MFKRLSLATLFLLLATISVAQKPRRLLHADMDITHQIVGTDNAFSGQRLPQAFRGEGVMIGVTDIGFDFTHPNFCGNRFVAFWDLLSRDSIGSLLPVGRDYAGHELQNIVKRSYDGLEQTHGTHVLGIAVGGDDHYRGIAPEADVVVINNLLSNNVEMMDSAALERLDDFYEFDEFRYMFNHAAERNMPCVINISAGYRQTFGDDFQHWNAVMSDMCGPGRIIVASAGNNGGQQTSLHKPSGKLTAGSGIYLYPRYAHLFLQTSDEVTLTLHVSSDLGQTKVPFVMHPTDAANKPDSTIIYSFTYNETPFSATIKEIESDYDGTPVFQIQFTDSLAYKLNANRLFLSVEGENADCTIFTQQALFEDRGEGFSDATNAYSVNFPACYDDVICVGGTTHRNEVINKNGESDAYGNGVIGQHFAYTSVGPRLDGYQKPDVVAPGSYVVSSYSSFYAETHPDAHDMHGEVATTNYKGRDYPWVSNSGTSMSAPIVTGIIALWLQANPNLTPADIKEVIAKTARHPDKSLPYPNDVYGYGEIDAYAGLLHLLGLSHIQEISQQQPQQIEFSVRNKTLELSIGIAGKEMVVSIYNIAGSIIANHNISSTDNKQTIDLSALPAGIYAVQVSAKEHLLHGSTLIRLK